MAAKFELEVMVSPSSARSLFQRALRLMPQEKKLWLEVRFLLKKNKEFLLISLFDSISNLNYSMLN